MHIHSMDSYTTTIMQNVTNMDDQLINVFTVMKTHLTHNVLTELASKLYAIRTEFVGDGAGLSGGILADKFVVKFISNIVPEFEEFYCGESDCKIRGHPLSIKKINGKSTIALDWSKNGEDSKKRERFDTDMMIINLKTGKWWKSYPASASPHEIETGFFSAPMRAGIYFISKTFCKSNICLSSNNKTNSLIESVQLYKMLTYSVENGMVIDFPSSYPASKFNILKAFES